MSLSIDLKYTLLISSRFEKFQRKQDYLFACRCPICGDSKKNKSKMRGYIYRMRNDLFYKCHNCAASMSIGNLLKEMDQALYKQYIMERYKAGEQGNANYKKPEFNIPSPKFGKLDIQTYENAESLDKLPKEHFCIKYCEARKIPVEMYSKLFYTNNFKKFCDEVNPNHEKELTEDKRLVIPFFDEYNSLIAISGRALENASEKLRYVTVRTNDSKEKLVYGKDRVNINERIYVVEGPIDSLFIDNCIASADSNLGMTAKTIDAKQITLIFDNEPRNKEICDLMQKAMKQGYEIVIWPENIVGKDINDMIINGISVDEIKNIISSNTFKNLEAQTKFVFWKKV